MSNTLGCECKYSFSPAGSITVALHSEEPVLNGNLSTYSRIFSLVKPSTSILSVKASGLSVCAAAGREDTMIMARGR